MLGELQPWFSGWPSLEQFRRDMDELLDRFLGAAGYRRPSSLTGAWPPVESFLRDGNWVLRFDMPGVDPKDIDVSVVGDILTIRAQRERRGDERNLEFEMREVGYGRFERSLTLPKGVASDQIEASYQRGVLELVMRTSPNSPAGESRLQSVPSRKSDSNIELSATTASDRRQNDWLGNCAEDGR